jgi:tetratricopeptide (TPR) repeat protein
MKRFCSFVAAFAAVAGSALCQEVPDTASDSFWRNDMLFNALTSVKEHNLTNIRKKPEAYRGLPIEMEIQFHSTRKANYPFFTRFTDDNYTCFTGWAGEAALWHRAEYQDVFSFFFVERKTPAMRTILEAKMYDRLRVSAVVRDVFRSAPYIEVTKVEIIDESDEATIVEAAKAEKEAEAENAAAAISHYEKALRGNLPKILRARMYCDVATLYAKRGDKPNALAQLEQAKKLQPDNTKFAELLEKAAQAPLPEAKNASGKKKNDGESVASRPAPKTEKSEKTADASTTKN